jgi:hypothetical protein
MVTQIDGIDVSPRVGSYIKPKHWPLGSCLAAGDSFSPFRLPTNSEGPIKSLAVRVEVSGRKLGRAAGRAGGLTVAVKITFVGDGEPDTVTSGYMVV